jgi:dTDP-4-amino-4,6-dideoxygalactose transaminase
MSEPHAIIGLTHFRHLPDFIAERNRLARTYDRLLQGIPGIRPLRLAEGTVSNYYKYIVMLDEKIDRTRLKKILRENYDVGLSGEVYELPLHLQPIFEGQYRQGDLPKAEYVCAHHVCMPLFQQMTEEDVHYVATSIRAALGAI